MAGTRSNLNFAGELSAVEHLECSMNTVLGLEGEVVGVLNGEVTTFGISGEGE